MDKVIRDRRVGLVLSNEHWGWYTQHGELELVYHPKIIKLIEEEKAYDTINQKYLQKLLGRKISHIDSQEELNLEYPDLRVEWVEVGKEVYISEPYGDYSQEDVIYVEHMQASKFIAGAD